MRRLKLGAFACLGLLVAFSVQWWGCGPVQPGDWMLKLRFMRHRPELERIVAMSDEDPQMSRIAPDFLWTQDSVAWPRPEPKWGITKERWDEYIKIFKQVDCDAGAKRGGNDVEVIVWRWGVVAGGSSINYLHCGRTSSKDSRPHEPACVERKESGRGHYGGSMSYGYRFKRIRDDWYILEQFN